jgi:hypothetical protein
VEIRPSGLLGASKRRVATVSVMVDEPASLTDVKRMRLRYAGICVRCGTSLAAGTTADYDLLVRRWCAWRARPAGPCKTRPPIEPLP